MKPLVSIITPTTQSRAHFMPRLLGMVAAQDYPTIEHIIIDDEDKTVGEKRNMACERANGEIIIHFDSDDLYALDWVSKSVEALQGLEITGLSQIIFYKPDENIGYKYSFSDNPLDSYAAGATLCYYKSFWERMNFRKINVGEDTRFVMDEPCRIKAHGYIDGFVATVHGDNTSPNTFTGYRFQKLSNSAINENQLIRKFFSNP